MLMSPGCNCCATTNVNTTPCAPCNVPPTTTNFSAVLTYRDRLGGEGTLAMTLKWFAPSALWCNQNPNTALGCTFAMNDYDGAWLTDFNNQPCFSATNNWATNHNINVQCNPTGQVILIRHLVFCASGASGRTFTFTVSAYPRTTTTCAGNPGGTTLIYTRADTSTNPDRTFTISW